MLKYNKTKMCVFGLKRFNFIINRTIFLEQNFKNGIFGPVDKFKQASKQKRKMDAFLKFKQSKHLF